MKTKPQFSSPQPATPGIEAEPEWLRLVREYVRTSEYGVVQITIQKGEVILIERTDRLRFEKPE